MIEDEKGRKGRRRQRGKYIDRLVKLVQGEKLHVQEEWKSVVTNLLLYKAWQEKR